MTAATAAETAAWNVASSNKRVGFLLGADCASSVAWFSYMEKNTR